MQGNTEATPLPLLEAPVCDPPCATAFGAHTAPGSPKAARGSTESQLAGVFFEFVPIFS